MSNDFSLIEFFINEPPWSFAAKGGKFKRRLQVKLVRPILQPLRDQLNAPMIITSGYRCYEHNKWVGGVENSHHLFEADRSAVDFTTADMSGAWKWLKARCGLFCYAYWHKEKNFIHVSGRTKTDNRVGQMWTLGEEENNG